MGKKKKNKAHMPTTNPFWVKLGQAAADQTANSNSNKPEQSKPTTSSTKTDQLEFKAAELVDEEKKSEITIDTDQIHSGWNEVSQASQDHLDFSKDLTEDEIQQIQSNKEQLPVATNSGGPTNANKNSKAVVQGLASKIMFVVQDSKKEVELASTSNKKQNVWGNQRIQSRITRNKQTIEEQQQAIAHLVKQNKTTPQSQEVTQQRQEVTAQRQEVTPQRKEVTPQRQEVTSQRKEVTPQRQEVTPQRKEVTPQVNQAAPTPRKQSKGQEAKHPTGLGYFSYPKGIPRSFYENQSAETPEPYSRFSSIKPQENLQQSTPNWQPVNTPSDMNAMWQPNVPYPTQQQQPMYDQTVGQPDYPQAYSPSDVYADNLASGSQDGENDEELELENPDLSSGQKRTSAFDRLGPVSQPKKPKLTINLLFNKEQAIREVVDETPEEPEKEPHVPVHLREEIISSTDETVVKYLPFWPWKKPVPRLKTVTVRNSKSVMLLEKEQMEELYDRNNIFFVVSIKGYPSTWTKENVLDTLMDSGYKLIPTFIEFTSQECNFFVIRSRAPLLAIHKAGFIIRKDDFELTITISSTNISLNHIEFIPKLVLRKRLTLAYDGEKSMDLSNFTLKEDISHFIYFPLNQSFNQMSIAQQLQTTHDWENITELILSHNKITSIDGFNLAQMTPKLKLLDLSFNHMEEVLSLINIRDLGLRSIKLEGNPLCNNYIDPDHYVKVLKTMFSSLQEIDGIPIRFKGDMPPFEKNYCPEDAKPIVEKFLEVYFPLLETPEDERVGMEELYHEKASMTVTYRFKLRYSNIYRFFRSLFHRSRIIDEGDTDSIDGASEIAKHIDKWPPLKHDPGTFTIDVLHHDDFATVFKVAGVFKLTSESLAEDEFLVAFTRTFVLQSYDGYDYKITNEMIYWDVPTTEYADNAFQIPRTIKQKRLTLALDSAPEEDLKEGLLQIFMQLTDLDKSASERCLEQKKWNLKIALDYFMKLLKLDDLETLTKEIKT